MSEVAVISTNVSGDIGQQGISRFHVERQDLGTITVTDCNAAGAAMRTLWQAAAAAWPNNLIWQWSSQVSVIESSSAIIQRVMIMSTVPANVAGAVVGSYAGGNGMRINWTTATVGVRRFMRASNYFVPLANVAYSNSGALSSSIIATMSTAAQTCLNSLATANLNLVAYHRPGKGLDTGGRVGIVTGYSIPNRPATLRSRRE